MKINFVLPAIGHSGGIDVINRYADLMTEAGHDIVVYKGMFAPNMHRYPSKIKNGVHQLYCTCKAFKEKKNDRKNDKYVLTISDRYLREADATVATSWPTAYQVAKLDNKCGKKWYFIQDYEIWDNEELGRESYKLPLNKIVISTWINDQLKKNLDIGPFPVVYNGIDNNVFNPQNRTKHEGITFLMLNHTLEKKGVKQGLEVYQRIHTDYPNTRLRMFGMCPNDNIPNDIEYYQNPSKDTLLKLYRDTDIFIYPSLEEGWGLTPLEAMACGCVVVGTNTGFVLDLGKHEENMMISDPGDIDGMVKNIGIIMTDREMTNNLSKEGLKTAEELSWKESSGLFLRILQGGIK